MTAMTSLDDLRARLGPGPAFIVQATNPASLTLWVGNELVELAKPISLLHDRLDLVCITVELGEVFARAVSGAAGPCPVAPAIPDGWVPVATARVKAGCCFVRQTDIEEWHP